VSILGCGAGTRGVPAPSSISTSSSIASPAVGSIAWQSPVAVSSSPLVAVSCATATFCVALDGAGNAYRFNGSQWSTPSALGGQSGLGGEVAAVSCTSPSFCMAIAPGSDAVVSWNGSSWSSPVTVSSNDLQGVSCVGTTFCATVDGVGDAFVYHGTGWARGSGDWGGISGISCVSPSFCMSVSGGTSAFDGSTWTQPNQQGATANFTGVSCPTTSFCMAVDAVGQALVFTGTWSAPTEIEPSAAPGGTSPTPSAVSCWEPGACVVTDNAGEAISIVNGSQRRLVIDPQHDIDAVSCAATLCLAVDAEGDAIAGTR